MARTIFNNKRPGSVGNPSAFEGPALLMFIDILGFSERVENHWKNGETVDVLRRIHRKTSELSKLTSTEYNRYSEYNYAGIYKAHIRSFSDTIIACFALPSNPSLADIWNGLWTLSQIQNILWREIIEAGFTIRGGVELGHIVWDDDILTGPALIKGHILESKVASWSRVVVGKELLRSLVDISATFMRERGDFLTISSDGLIEMPLRFNRDRSRSELLEQISGILAGNLQAEQKFRPLIEAIRSNGTALDKSSVRSAIAKMEAMERKLSGRQ